MKITLLALIAVLFALPAFAQQVDIRVTPPAPAEKLSDLVAPGMYYDVTEPRENPWYPEGVRVPYDPAFIAPLTQEYETNTSRGSVGFAGWTAQNIPVGAPEGYREQYGWLQFGLAITWGAPLRRTAPPAARPASVGPAPAPAR